MNILRTSIILILLFMVALLIIGCSNQEKIEIKDVNNRTDKIIEIKDEDNGSKINLKKSQKLKIILESNLSTGYSWEIEDFNKEVLKQEGEIEYKTESDLIGSEGIQIIEFESVKKGETEVKLVYHRPWEKDVKPNKVYTVKIEVR